jgi:sec-independent protein translocase protein TatC
MSEELKDFLEVIKPHVTELRRRLLVSLVVLAVMIMASFALANQLIQIITLPVGGVQNLQSIEITENVGVFMRVSLISGLIFAFPFLIYEILAFILPGLKPEERRWVFVLVPVMTLLFLAGVSFAYFVMLPNALPFLLGFLGVKTTPRLSSYVNFVTSLVFWLGIGFESPIVIFFLAKFNIVSAKTLLKQWRVAIIVIAILAAVITPTVDPVNMGLLMLPLIALYFISVLFAFIANK